MDRPLGRCHRINRVLRVLLHCTHSSHLSIIRCRSFSSITFRPRVDLHRMSIPTQITSSNQLGQSENVLRIGNDCCIVVGPVGFEPTTSAESIVYGYPHALPDLLIPPNDGHRNTRPCFPFWSPSYC